jgi:t-SNARE complex subunit (syntaxin)
MVIWGIFSTQSGGCSFRGWYEPPHDDFVRDLLVDLHDAVWNLKRERVNLQQELAAVGNQLEQEKTENARLLAAIGKQLEQAKTENARLLAKVEEHVASLAKVKMETQRLVLFLVLLGLVMVVVGMRLV